MSQQRDRRNPQRPSVVYSGYGVWCARAYDPNGNFQVKGKLSLPEAYEIATQFASGNYSEAQQ